MSDDNKFTQRLRNGGGTTSDEDVTRAVAEDRRLVEMGIDPDGDPIDNMVKVRAMKEALMKKLESGEY